MRRGFTLLETMIVVLIVTAISAIFLPALASRATDAELGNASRGIESGAALAAARSMERGSMIALVAEDWDGEWVLWAEEVEPAGLGELLRPSEDLPPLPPEEDAPPREELLSFEGVRLTDELPPAVDPATGEALAEQPEEDVSLLEAELREPGVRPRLVLAVFFPDGSCRPGAPVYLVSDDGRREVVRFMPLTGRVEIRGLPPEAVEAEQVEEAEPGAPLSPPPTGRAGGGEGGPP